MIPLLIKLNQNTKESCSLSCLTHQTKVCSTIFSFRAQNTLRWKPGLYFCFNGFHLSDDQVHLKDVFFVNSTDLESL